MNIDVINSLKGKIIHFSRRWQQESVSKYLYFCAWNMRRNREY